MLGMDVLTAARSRISQTFEGFKRICVAFSGGKDSTVVAHLAMEEARRCGRRIGLLFIDWEAQYKHTVAFVERIFDEYADVADPYWVALPLTTTNACSAIEPEWVCWDPAKRTAWVRQRPVRAMSPSALPFYRHAMTFEEFTPEFARWYSAGTPTAMLVGIRAQESLNRLRSVARADKDTWSGRRWTTGLGDGVYNAYPIYDWTTEDIWTYMGRERKAYNPIYDLMRKAGLTIHQMRICEPYGDEQRKGLWLFHILEPSTWPLVAARVAGANAAALDALGKRAVVKPDGYTWQGYVKFLLSTMPASTAEHYRNKFSVWRRWYDTRSITISDELPDDTGAEDKPSWRRLAKVLLRNDYWCKALMFGPQKVSSYDDYKAMMARLRAEWRMKW
jgi:predicted phosphoadenosine phosphosulfate sulfurtransferase